MNMKLFDIVVYFISVILSVFLSIAARADPLRTNVPQVLLMEGETGTVLFAQNADSLFSPATLTKMMTAEVIFEALQKGEIKPDTQYPVSRNAWRKGGAPSRATTMFARLNSKIRVNDLLQGLVVINGNDSALILAEGFSGSEEAFVERMNKHARILGMTQSHFVNSTGLPAEGQQATLRDMLLLARHIQKNHPQYFSLYAQPSFEWSRIFQRNRNPLLGQEGIGADGFATGFVKKMGYSVVTTAYTNNRRLFLAMNGLTSEKQRVAEAVRILKWGFQNFERKLIYDPGDLVGEAKVYGGTAGSVALKTVDPVAVMLPKVRPPQLTARIRYQGPLQAPVEEGAYVGTISILSGNDVLVEQPVIAAAPAEAGGLTRKAWDALLEVSFGWIRKYL